MLPILSSPILGHYITVRDCRRRDVVSPRVSVVRIVAFGSGVAAQHGRPGCQDGLREGHADAQEQARQNVSLICSLHALNGWDGQAISLPGVERSRKTDAFIEGEVFNV